MKYNSRDIQTDFEVSLKSRVVCYFTIGTTNKVDIIKYPFSFIYVTRTLFVPINGKTTPASMQHASSSISCVYDTKAITCYILK